MNNGYKITGQIVQGGSLFKTPIDVTVSTKSGMITKRIMIDQMVTPINLVVVAEPTSVELDKDNWILQTKPLSDESRTIALKK